MPPKQQQQRKTDLKEKHLIKYGLRKVLVDLDSNKTVKVICRFCQTGAREGAVGALRKATTNLKVFVHPFRSDKFLQHVSRQHLTRWTAYNLLSENSKKTYFDTPELTNVDADVPAPAPIAATLYAHFAPRRVDLQFSIKKEIIDSLIGGVLFDPEEDGVSSKECALAPFVEDPEHDNAYAAKVKSKLEFHTVVGLLAIGMCFRTVEQTTKVFNECGASSKIGTVSRQKVSQWSRIVCAVNLQTIGNLLTQAWTFSIAMDMSTHQATAYLNIRVRVYANGAIHDLHLLAAPVFSGHTADAIYLHSTKVLDVLCPEWPRKIVSITTDGELKLTDSIREVATQFERAAEEGFFRLWCGLQQLDFCLQRFYSNLMGKKLYSTMRTFIGYLRHQESLMSTVTCQCPTVADTRWESVSKAFTWLKANGTTVMAYLEEKNPEQKPSRLWWVVVNALVFLSNEATSTFRALEGKTTLVSTQTEQLTALHTQLAEVFSIFRPLVPLGDEVTFPLTEYSLSKDRKFVVKNADILVFFRNLGDSMNTILDRSPPEEVQEATADFSSGIVELLANLNDVIAERNSRNEAGESIPSVLPHILATIQPLEFTLSLRKQKTRLLTTWTQADFEQIEDDLQDLQSAFRNELPLRTFLESCPDDADFEATWGNPELENRFAKLRLYCGGLATAFPGTSTVESDFSILKCEKDDGRASLCDFVVEGVMQSKQFFALDALNSSQHRWNN